MAGQKVKSKFPDTEIIRTTVWSAGPGCHGTCGVLAHIKKGKLAKISPALETTLKSALAAQE